MRILDRYLLQLFIRAFLICFCSLVGLYVIIDAFANLDEFSERSHGLFRLLSIMGHYYLYRVSVFFDRWAGVITMLAAMFTLSWIQRTNELMPVLAAGVPTRRIVAPVILAAMAICGLTVFNQELVIPRIANQLRINPDDDSKRPVGAHAVHDSRGILFAGGRCNRQEQKVAPVYVTLQPQLVGHLQEIRVGEAEYVKPTRKEPAGGWILHDVSPANIQCSETVLQPLEPGSYFLHTTVTFDQVRRQQSAFEFSSTRELLKEIQRPDNTERKGMAVLVHARLTRPLATLTLLFLGLPFVLSGTDRRMVNLVGMSLVVGVSFQLFTFFCQYLANASLMEPPLAAWLPVLIFGTLAVALNGLVRT